MDGIFSENVCAVFKIWRRKQANREILKLFKQDNF